MKKITVRISAILFAVVLLVSGFSGCAKISYVTAGMANAVDEIKSGSWNEVETSVAVKDKDEIVIKAFEPGTYGSVEFKSINDVVDFYNESYNYTKTLTAQYKDKNGEIHTYYKLIGENLFTINEILVEGKSNEIINRLVPMLTGLFGLGATALCPANSINPDKDIDDNGESLRTSRMTADDLLEANVEEVDEHTVTITLQPKSTEMSNTGMDSQGHVFTTLGKVTDEDIASYKILTWAEGGADQNLQMLYTGGTAVVTIDTNTKEIISADYKEIIDIAIIHANVTVIKDKAASGTVTYDIHYPASDKFLAKYADFSRV